MDNQITFAEAAEVLANKKKTIESRLEIGDTWTKNALQPKLDKINKKIEELKVLNDEARKKVEYKKFAKTMDENPMFAEQLLAEKGQEQFVRGGYPSKYQNNIDMLEGSYAMPPRTIIYGESNPEKMSMRNPTREEWIPSTAPSPYRDDTEIARMTPRGISGISRTSDPLLETTPSPYNESLANKTAIKEDDGFIYGDKDPRKSSMDYREALKNYGKFGEGVTQIAPSLYNMYRGLMPYDKLIQIHNPNVQKSEELLLDSMYYNANPELAASQEMGATARAMARTGSQGHGGAYYMMNMNALRNKAMQDAAILAKKEAYENDAKRAVASGLLSSGQMTQAERQRKQQYDIQSRANRDLFFQTGLKNMADYSQMNELMKNQKDIDVIKARALEKGMPAFFYDEDFLEAYKEAKEKKKAKDDKTN